MSKTLLTFFLSFLCQFLYAQQQDLIKEMIGNYIQIRQKAHTEKAMTEWLQNLPVKNDTVYAILYVPMDCPRCEAAITNFQERLKAIDRHQELILISAYPDSLLAKEYNQRNGYIADAFLYDTTEHYQNILRTNMSGGLMGLHILKIDRKNGNLLVGGQYTVLNNLFVKQLIAYNDMTEKVEDVEDCHSEENDDESLYTHIPENIPLLSSYDSLLVDSVAHVSTLFDVPHFINDHLFFTDVLHNGVMVFHLDKHMMKYKGLLQVAETEKKRFIEVSDSAYRHLVKHHMLFYIALGANMLDENHIGISYSIPKVVRDGADNAYGIYNAPIILSRNIYNMKSDSTIVLDFDLENETFFYQHFTFAKHQDKLAVGCKKMTWPMEYEREEYENEPERNPFCSQFYDTDNPIVALFNTNGGKLYKRYGALDESQRISYTGYYFSSPIFASHQDEFLYGNGRVGKVVIINKAEDSGLQYNVFDIETTSFPQPDSTTFYTYDCVKPYNKFFNRCITDVKFDKHNIYCIIKYALPDSDKGARYVYAIVNRKNKKVREYAFPLTNETIIGVGLRDKNHKITPFMLTKEEMTAKVCLYR
ncbi:MAG: hypothetical protein K6F43_07155 [Prevotella sp.]|jgi:hypothetical protein|nr:hypothetical protein [Prevotella sp.]